MVHTGTDYQSVVRFIADRFPEPPYPCTPDIFRLLHRAAVKIDTYGVENGLPKLATFRRRKPKTMNLRRRRPRRGGMIIVRMRR
jgi:hypothetical protein